MKTSKQIFVAMVTCIILSSFIAKAQQKATKACSNCGSNTFVTASAQTDDGGVLSINGLDIYYYWNVVEPPQYSNSSSNHTQYQMCISKVVNTTNSGLSLSTVDYNHAGGVECYDPYEGKNWVSEIGLIMIKAHTTVQNISPGTKFTIYDRNGGTRFYDGCRGPNGWGATFYSKDIKGFANVQVTKF